MDEIHFLLLVQGTVHTVTWNSYAVFFFLYEKSKILYIYFWLLHHNQVSLYVIEWRQL